MVDTAPPRPADDPRYTSFFGVLAPVDQAIRYRDQDWAITWRYPTLKEEMDLQVWRALFEPEQHLTAEFVGRFAYTVLAVDGVLVETEHATFEQRAAWVQSWPDPLFKAMLHGWNAVRDLPNRLASEMAADRFFARARSDSGDSSSVQASTPDAS